MNSSPLRTFAATGLVAFVASLAVLAGCSSSQAPPLTTGTGTNPPPGGGGDGGTTTMDSGTPPVDAGEEDATTSDAGPDGTLPPPHDSGPDAPVDAPVIFGNDANDFPDANTYDGAPPCFPQSCAGCCSPSGCVNNVSNTQCGAVGSTCQDCTLDGGTCLSTGSCQ